MAIKFQTNVPLTLTFPYGDHKEINGPYGQQFQYTVELAGQRDKLFATPALHQKLQAAGIGPGAVLTVAKIEAEGNRKGWVIAPENDQEEEPLPANGNDTASHAPINGTAHGNGRSTDPPDGPNFSDLQTLMGNCIRASWEAWRSVDHGDFDFRSEDVRGVGITLFLEASRKGIFAQPVEAGLPF